MDSHSGLPIGVDSARTRIFSLVRSDKGGGVHQIRSFSS